MVASFILNSHCGISAGNGVPLFLIGPWQMAKLEQSVTRWRSLLRGERGWGSRVPHKQQTALPEGFWEASFIV